VFFVITREGKREWLRDPGGEFREGLENRRLKPV